VATAVAQTLPEQADQVAVALVTQKEIELQPRQVQTLEAVVVEMGTAQET
jgi:hypothetical protein